MADDEKPDKLIPFSDYDYFGYLACGFLALGGIDILNGSKWLTADKFPIPMGVCLVVLAYVVGHLIAGFSHSLFERYLVHKVLGAPSELLFATQRPPAKGRLFHGYYHPFPEPTQRRIREQAERLGMRFTGEPLFQRVFSIVKRDEACMQRLASFRNMYGFCRNVSFTALALSIAYTVVGIIHHKNNFYEWAVIALIVSIGMFYRFLKFYQQYSRELFLHFMHSDQQREAGR